MSMQSINRQSLLIKALLMLLVLEMIGVAPALAGEGDSAVHIGGDVSKSADWTLEQLKQRFGPQIKKIEYASKGQPHSSNCIALLDMLAAAGVPTDMKMEPRADPKVKNYPLRLAVVVQGRDGYAATFSLAELLPGNGNRAAWIALDMDGMDLSEREGPVKLIVPEDAKPGRWVHGIGKIMVVDVATAAK
jgi:hypothetical protein